MSYTAAWPSTFSMPMVLAQAVSGTNMKWISTGTATSAGWPAANRALFLPITIPSTVVVKRLWVLVGTTGGTDTWDLGLYTDGGTQIVHMGSTTAGTANTVQFMDITDTVLAPGAYYMAMSSSGTTAHTRSWGAGTVIGLYAMSGLLQMATAHPLPATATFATVASLYTPIIGYCTTATP